MVKPKISILVPVYNGGEYLKKLIDNLQNQTFKDFEVVLVEDSSTDDSMAFLQSRAKEDKRLKVIHRTEKGGTAIKGIVWGFPYCEGEYFLYMSQDDLIENDTLEKLYNKALQTGADIVVPNMLWFYEDGTDGGGRTYDENKEIDAKEAFILSLRWKLHAFNLRKMDMIKKVGFDDLYYNSDEYAARVHYFYANKVAFCNTTFFYRQDNPNAITKGNLKPFKFEVFLNALRLIDFSIKHNLQKHKEFSKFIRRTSRMYKHFCHNPSLQNFNKEETARLIEICDEFRKEFLALAWKSKRPLFILRALRSYLVKPKIKK